MSLNPYLPSQVDSSKSIGLLRVLAIAAAYSSQQGNLRFYGFRTKTLLFGAW